MQSAGEIVEIHPYLWDGETPYKRYNDMESGISPIAIAPQKEAVIKVNSYEHDEFGITTEDITVTKKMQDKRLRKGKYLIEELKGFRTVNTYGNDDHSTALLGFQQRRLRGAGAKVGIKSGAADFALSIPGGCIQGSPEWGQEIDCRGK
jgi:pyruvate/2-oxoacid:ferredoxin oxidoreductase alpha subunit